MLFVIDFDGTLSDTDSVDGMLEEFAPSVWKNAEQDWLAGNITAFECMRKQIRMVRASRVDLENLFRTIELDDSFLTFYRYVSQFAHLAIVSDGLDHAIHTSTCHAGFPEIPVYANRLLFLSDGIDISFPHYSPRCKAGNGVCKCAVAHGLSGLYGGRTVLVGDGKSDYCLAENSDVVFAKGALLKHCQDQGIVHTPFNNFADVLASVRSWDTKDTTDCHDRTII